MTYAMVLENRVIDVLKNREAKPYYPPDLLGNPVIAIPCDETVTVGMIYDTETGTFSEYAPPPTPVSETEPSQLSRIEGQQLIIMEAVATQYEESLENRINDMEVQATIYETLLEIQGGLV